MVMSELTGEVNRGVISISSVLEMGSLLSLTNKEIIGCINRPTNDGISIKM